VRFRAFYSGRPPGGVNVLPDGCAHRGRERRADSLSSYLMGQTFTDRLRAIGSATLIVLVLTGASNAADASVCAVSANPSKFDHQSVTLEGIVTALFKETSRRHRKEMTFTLRSLAGCGSVLVYAQEPVTVSNGDHIRVEGVFETEHHRDGMTFHNEMQATNVTAMPR
jgi:hypothetical protein